MIKERITTDRLVSGLRTKYFPKSRINQGLVSVAPWVNVVLLMIMFVIVDSRMILQPGIVVSIPEGPFKGGSHPDMVVVVRATEKQDGGIRSERVFFEDQSFLVDDPAQMKQLGTKLAVAARSKTGANMVILADARVWHGTIIKLFGLAEESGIKSVNLGIKEIAAGGHGAGPDIYEGD